MRCPPSASARAASNRPDQGRSPNRWCRRSIARDPQVESDARLLRDLRRIDVEERLERHPCTLRLAGVEVRAPQGLDVDLETGLVYVSNNGSAVAGCQPGPGVEGTMSIVDPAQASQFRAQLHLHPMP